MLADQVDFVLFDDLDDADGALGLGVVPGGADVVLVLLDPAGEALGGGSRKIYWRWFRDFLFPTKKSNPLHSSCGLGSCRKWRRPILPEAARCSRYIERDCYKGWDTG